MTSKQFNLIKIIVVIALASLVSQSVLMNNYWLASGAIVVAFLVIVIAKRQVKEIMVDERDYQIAGHAARYALTTYSVLGVAAMFLFLSEKDQDPVYGAIAFAIAYSVCALMLFYSLIFTYLHKGLSHGRKSFIFVLAFIIIFLFVAGSLRVFTPEDEWLCQNGAWVAHGQPSAPMPTKICE
jgi:uncharacterized membrane protein